VRVLKDTNVRYKSFVETLYSGSGSAESQDAVIDVSENKESTDNNGLRLINSFAKKIENAKTVIDTTETLSLFFVNNFGVTGSEIFLFDKSKKNLVPLGINKNGRFLSLIKHLTDEESIDWIFNKRTHINLVISDADYLMEKSNDEIITMCSEELQKYCRLKREDITGYKVLKEKRATIVSSIDSVYSRPSNNTRLKNLFLAGDWTDTGLPSTIESAAKSGRTAAEIALKIN